MSLEPIYKSSYRTFLLGISSTCPSYNSFSAKQIRDIYLDIKKNWLEAIPERTQAAENVLKNSLATDEEIRNANLYLRHRKPRIEEHAPKLMSYFKRLYELKGGKETLVMCIGFAILAAFAQFNNRPSKRDSAA